MLPIHPQPRSDEILSSWMVRLAFDNGFPLHTFYACLIGYRGAIWNRDIDRHPSQALLQMLGQHTGQSMFTLQALTLSSYQGLLFEQLPLVGNPAWILPVGVFHRARRRAGLQYCPICLGQGQIPYYRRAWRLAFYAMCEHHLCIMQDHCLDCGSIVAFHRHGIGRGKDIFPLALRFCHQCGFDLSQVPSFIPNWPDVKSLVQLRKTIGNFERGEWSYGQHTSACGVPYFQGLRAIISVINGRNGFRLRQQLTRILGVNFGVDGGESRLEFEYLCAAERLKLMLTVTWLLEGWPVRFLAICTGARFTRSRLAEEVRALPFWLSHVADEYLDNRTYMPCNQEIISAGNYLISHHQEVSPEIFGQLLGLTRDSARAAYHLWQSREV